MSENSEPQTSTLSNGIRVVTQSMDQLQTVSLGVWVGTGARYEMREENGISHFLEHMAFKGTKKRTAKDIVEEIEQVGGDLNAATSLETTAYYARVMQGDECLALDVLSDILLNATFELDELERERDVILQEIAGTFDCPEDVVYDLVQDAAYPEQPLGRTILGTPESVKAIGSHELRGFLNRHYVPERMVVSAAGAVSHNVVCNEAEKLFGALKPQGAMSQPSATYQGGARGWDKEFEQSHVVIAFEGPSIHDDDFYAAQVFSGLFGGGMSSRLFQEVRERRGLCYSTYSSSWGLTDTGMFSIYAATGQKTVDEFIKVSGEELAKVAASGVTEREVQRAKSQLKSGLLMSLESSSARAEQMARHTLVYNRLRSSDELIAKVENVTIDSVQRFAQKLLTSAPSTAVVGAGSKSGRLAEQAKTVFAA